jgi:hypothetical protein
MINPFDYLFYKIHTAWSHISGNGSSGKHHGAMMILLMLNFFTIYELIYGYIPLDISEHLRRKGFTSDLIVLASGIFIIFISPVFYSSKREKRIIAKYKNESEKSRIIGNAIVICYVILTFASLYFAR